MALRMGDYEQAELEYLALSERSDLSPYHSQVVQAKLLEVQYAFDPSADFSKIPKGIASPTGGVPLSEQLPPPSKSLVSPAANPFLSCIQGGNSLVVPCWPPKPEEEPSLQATRKPKSPTHKPSKDHTRVVATPKYKFKSTAKKSLTETFWENRSFPEEVVPEAEDYEDDDDDDDEDDEEDGIPASIFIVCALILLVLAVILFHTEVNALAGGRLTRLEKGAVALYSGVRQSLKSMLVALHTSL